MKWCVDFEVLVLFESDEGGWVVFLNLYDGMLFDCLWLCDFFEFDYVFEQFKLKLQCCYGLFVYLILVGD